MPATSTPPERPPGTELDEVARHLAEDRLTSPAGHPDEMPDERIARLEARVAAGEERRAFASLGMLLGLVAIAAALITGFVLLSRDGGAQTGAAEPSGASAATPGHTAGMHHDAGATGRAAAVEPYKRPDPTLPAVPSGDVKRFRIQVFEHVTRVAPDKPAAKVWSYAVNGVAHRGTGVSTPMVVTEGDQVQIELSNQGSESFKVDFPHSIDFHSAEVAPEEDYATIAPGQTKSFRFTAKHPGVFMYHCATDPVLMHTGAGMVGAMIVKPKGLAPVDKELWITQQEYYLGPGEGASADMDKMRDEQPDVIAFNGYANQYRNAPIAVRTGERVRMYVLNAGPSIWSAFHVIGTVFDRTVIEGQRGAHAQTVNLAPSQGGWVDFTLDKPGLYPFVNHSFAAAAKGAAGALKATGAPRTTASS